MADRFGAPMIVLAAVAFSLIAGAVKNGNPAGRVLQVVLPNGQTLGMAYLRTGQEH
jgi:hypothetical protein